MSEITNIDRQKNGETTEGGAWAEVIKMQQSPGVQNQGAQHPDLSQEPHTHCGPCIPIVWDAWRVSWGETRVIDGSNYCACFQTGAGNCRKHTLSHWN